MEIKNIVAGKRFISKTGEEKTQWTNVGALFIKDDGTMSVKFNGFINPLAFANEKGEVWFNVFDKDKKTDKNSPKTSNSFDNHNYIPEIETNSSQVVKEGNAYAEKWRREAEKGKSFEELQKALETSDEEWFKKHSEEIPF